ncbi:hypothetical protein [Paenibacillus elgii]|nr:hypothetical protein [Paenibacillus elgii]
MTAETKPHFRSEYHYRQQLLKEFAAYCGAGNRSGVRTSGPNLGD